MPGDSNTIDWSGVRTLAVAVGVREAARKLGISVDMVRKRSSREGWLKEPAMRESAQRAVKERALAVTMSPAVTTPAKAMAAELADLSGKSRLSFARGLNTAANHVEGMPGPELLQQAQNVKALSAAAGNVHGWTENNTRVSICLAVTGQHTIETEVPIEAPIDAEWSDEVESPKQICEGADASGK